MREADEEDRKAKLGTREEWDEHVGYAGIGRVAVRRVGTPPRRADCDFAWARVPIGRGNRPLANPIDFGDDEEQRDAACELHLRLVEAELRGVPFDVKEEAARCGLSVYPSFERVTATESCGRRGGHSCVSEIRGGWGGGHDARRSGFACDCLTHISHAPGVYVCA